MMYPITRHVRHPLVPTEPEPVSNQSVALESHGEVLTAASSSNSDRPKVEKRSDFGQFWTDFSNPQPSTLNPQPLWSRQPNEPAADYQLFAAWLQLPAPCQFRKAAATLDCSLHRLRQLSSRHNWKTRAAAFDEQRANAASRALDELLSKETSDYKERARLFREQEWLLHEQMCVVALDAVREFKKHPERVKMSQLVKLIDLASVLGRRAAGMPLDPKSAEPDPTPDNSDFEAALRKVYGNDGF